MKDTTCYSIRNIFYYAFEDSIYELVYEDVWNSVRRRVSRVTQIQIMIKNDLKER